MSRRIEKSREQWAKQLTAEPMRIARDAGTEKAFSGDCNSHKGDGIYTCVCCSAALFNSAHKYDSGSGWPSYWSAIRETAIEEQSDHCHGRVRTAALCDACGSHLGHVFPDGPPPTGMRHCINSTSLNFQSRSELELEIEQSVNEPAKVGV